MASSRCSCEASVMEAVNSQRLRVQRQTDRQLNLSSPAALHREGINPKGISWQLKLNPPGPTRTSLGGTSGSHVRVEEEGERICVDFGSKCKICNTGLHRVFLMRSWHMSAHEWSQGRKMIGKKLPSSPALLSFVNSKHEGRHLLDFKKRSIYFQDLSGRSSAKH